MYLRRVKQALADKRHCQCTIKITKRALYHCINNWLKDLTKLSTATTTRGHRPPLRSTVLCRRQPSYAIPLIFACKWQLFGAKDQEPPLVGKGSKYLTMSPVETELGTRDTHRMEYDWSDAGKGAIAIVGMDVFCHLQENVDFFFLLLLLQLLHHHYLLPSLDDDS